MTRDETLLMLRKILEALKVIGERLGVTIEAAPPPPPPRTPPAPPIPPVLPPEVRATLADVLGKVSEVVDFYTPHDSYYPDEPSVTKNSPYELDVTEVLGRKASTGYIINDGDGDVLVIFNKMMTRKVRVKPGEQLDIADLKLLVSHVRIETSSTTPVSLRLLLA